MLSEWEAGCWRCNIFLIFYLETYSEKYFKSSFEFDALEPIKNELHCSYYYCCSFCCCIEQSSLQNILFFLLNVDIWPLLPLFPIFLIRVLLCSFIDLPSINCYSMAFLLKLIIYYIKTYLKVNMLADTLYLLWILSLFTLLSFLNEES